MSGPLPSCALDLRVGDCRAILPTIGAESVQCCVTSPPYWGLRDYGGHAEQLGLESSPEAFLDEMVAVFREVRRVLRKDGTCWLNMGDGYCGAPGGHQGQTGERSTRTFTARILMEKKGRGLKRKDLVGMPWRLALALQADGWFLRADIIWHKPNPMPETVRDRPTKAHEYIFLLSKSESYFYNAEAIKEPVSGTAHARRGYKTPDGWDTSKGNGGHGVFHKNGREKGQYRTPGVGPKSSRPGSGVKANESFHASVVDLVSSRNKRSVWTVPTRPFKGAHFATYPPELITPCILAGSRPGDVVLDPFGGSGTTGQVALELGRSALLIELNPEYAQLIEKRTSVTPGLRL